MWELQRGSGHQLNGGCGSCACAEYGTDRAVQAYMNGFNYWCKYFNRPVRTNEGKTCSKWVSDR